ncbi:MAG: cyclopropane-fatty-acyl-phospholipid synthase family protein [Phycisphaerales bacterium]
MTVLSIGMNLADRGRLPDALLRMGIRRLCARRLDSLAARNGASLDEFVRLMKQSPIAPVPDAANEQHYEVPSEFYALCLGVHRKYSGCYWPEGTRNLDEAEAHALRETCEHARLEDGQRILELGCGWGSLTLWMAEHYPNAEITAVSNSASQRQHIERDALMRKLSNIRVITADMNDFTTSETFDRVVSVEMFEHMRNYERLLARIASWLADDGLLFVHVFCHRTSPYEFDTDGAANWMGRHFFTGGIMPSERLLESFGRDLRVIDRWSWDGTHYRKTAEAWLSNLDANRDRAIEVLSTTLPPDEAGVQFNRWRIFFLACAETFGYRNGREWLVSHALLEKVSP